MDFIAELSMTVAMIVFAVLLVASAAGVVFSDKPLHSALFLVLTLFLSAVHYALLGAEFMAILQVLVYAGAIMVLVVFVIMLLGVDDSGEGHRLRRFALLYALSVGALGATLCFVVVGRGSILAPGAKQPAAGFGSVASIGEQLFTRYLLPFELASVLLLAAIIGAVLLSVSPKRPLPKGRGLRAKQNLGV